MKQTYRISLAAALAGTLLAAGCGTSPGTPAAPTGISSAGQPATSSAATGATTTGSTATGATATGSASSTPSGSTHLPVGNEPVTLDPADFTTDITNPYWPMKPRTRWRYREIDIDGSVTDGVVVATTKTQKLADGITARVVRDTAREDGQIVEDTIDWYAQDKAGNVWYLGEQTAEFEHGKIVSRSGSFEAGANGAVPGIILPAQPQVGQRYRQEYLKGQAEDNGEVLATDEMTQVPAGLYRHSLLTKDTSSIEPTVVEYKLYARGVGPALAITISGGTSREHLIKVDQAAPHDGTGPLGRPNG
jgi:hypothetical protein